MGAGLTSERVTSFSTEAWGEGVSSNANPLLKNIQHTFDVFVVVVQFAVAAVKGDLEEVQCH